MVLRDTMTSKSLRLQVLKVLLASEPKQLISLPEVVRDVKTLQKMNGGIKSPYLAHYIGCEVKWMAERKWVNRARGVLVWITVNEALREKLKQYVQLTEQIPGLIEELR